MIDTDDPLVFGVPRSWRRKHSGLPQDLADAGFVVQVAEVMPELRYRLVQGESWRWPAPDVVGSPDGTLDECIAWARAWLAGGALVQQGLDGSRVAVVARRSRSCRQPIPAPATPADGPLSFPSDRPLRDRFCTKESYGHPAKYHLGLLLWILDRYVVPGQTVADPMAGTGATGLAALAGCDVILRDVENPYLAMMHANAATIYQQAGLLPVGTIDIARHDARAPWRYQADVVLMSPPYGCDFTPGGRRRGMLSHQVRARLEKLGSYNKAWDRLLKTDLNGEYLNNGQRAAYSMTYGSDPDQIGHWRGKRYWQAMTQIYTNAHAAVRPGGLMILVIKDHIRRGKRVHTADETVTLCQELGFGLVERHARQLSQLSLWQRRRREAGLPVVEQEDVLVFERRSL